MIFFSIRITLLGCGMAVVARAGPTTRKEILPDPSVVSLSTEVLIGRLQDETPGDPKRRWPAMVSAFQPLDVPQRFEQNLPHDPRSPIMTELIRRGVGAVPLLLDHLTDARPTHLVEYHTPNMVNDGGTWFDDRYQPRSRGTEFEPAVNHEVNFKTTRELKAGMSYTVKVGDLCFVALGQIVNRPLLVFGSVVKGKRVFARAGSLNSPVEMPALATAARTDWTGLTRNEHERSLESDAWENGALGRQSADRYGAVQRLTFYYPEVGQRIIAELLQRPLIDYGEILEVAARLEREPHPVQVGIIANFQNTHTLQDYDALHRLIYRDHDRMLNGPRAEHLADVLTNCFPGQKINLKDRIRAVTYRDQAELVDTLEALESSELHDALYELFERAARHVPLNVDQRFYRNELLLSCAKQLRKTRYFDACAKVIITEISDLSAHFHAAQSDSTYNHPGSAAYQYQTYRRALTEWLNSASQVVAADGKQ